MVKEYTSELFLHKSAPLRDINFLNQKKQAHYLAKHFDEEFAMKCEGICGV